jgi:hypothetical protein
MIDTDFFNYEKDYVEFPSKKDFPKVGETNLFYIADDEIKIYVWNHKEKFYASLETLYKPPNYTKQFVEELKELKEEIKELKKLLTK